MRGSCVVVDVISSFGRLQTAELLDQARWMAHDGVEIVRGIVVDEAEGNLDAVGFQLVATGSQQNSRHSAADGGGAEPSCQPGRWHLLSGVTNGAGALVHASAALPCQGLVRASSVLADPSQQR